MGVTKDPKVEKSNPFQGTWNIYEMELWNEDYFNEEVQAYVEIIAGDRGDFQFGLVCGYLNGYLEQIDEVERFSFTWEGMDEMDDANGSGWLRLIGSDEVEGTIAFHRGDRSLFKAKKV